MMKMRKALLLIIILLVAFSKTRAQEKYYTYKKPARKEKIDIDHIAEFEVGFHAGKNWTVGNTREIADFGQVYSLNIGSNNGIFYWGTEFNLKFWDEILDSKKAGRKDFSKKQFLWLFQFKWFWGERKVQPYFGFGADFLSLTEEILFPDKEDEYDYSYYKEKDDKFLNYNAWFAPGVGLRCKLRPKISADISFNADLSDNYDSIRLQVGVVLQL